VATFAFLVLYFFVVPEPIRQKVIVPHPVPQGVRG
jgi:hypothetical protein